ncbi:hypothetical protein FAF44_11010 [Nonomuraea sp. MG754425]|uniref:hypothetical protein n=1 Tax=Nonomuraea sp. MG754425 TaxID=2570319 RepID=UPI001F3D513C|nr:hypothetical protein [Nonomuraea sp. MG754425]MCF6468911.1 hypothetical protein [Nonomuraea sp. MG754425]
MTPQWIGVVGTALGAAIGSLVAIASVFLRARQEAAAEAREHEREQVRRARDREWDITVQGLDARRQTYATLLRRAAAYSRHLEAITEQASAAVGDKRVPHPLRGELHTSRAELEDLVFEVDVHAQHPLVGDVLRQLLQEGEAAQDALEAGEWDQARELTPFVGPLVGRLRDVCRWDLGLYGPDPYEDLNGAPGSAADEEKAVEQEEGAPAETG